MRNHQHNRRLEGMLPQSRCLSATSGSLARHLEWEFGYTKRFGIAHVDFKTQARTPRQRQAILTDNRWYRGGDVGVSLRGRFGRYQLIRRM